MNTEKNQIRSSLHSEDKNAAVNSNTRYFYQTVKFEENDKEETLREEIGKVHLSYRNPESSYVLIYVGGVYRFDITYRLKKRACYYNRSYLAKIMREFFLEKYEEACEAERIRVIGWEIEQIAYNQEEAEKEIKPKKKRGIRALFKKITKKAAKVASPVLSVISIVG